MTTARAGFAALHIVLGVAVLGVTAACTSATSPSGHPDHVQPSTARTVQAGAGWSAGSTVRVLYFGNSHTEVHDVPATVARLLRVWAGVNVESTVSPDRMLLNERGSHRPSLELLGSRRWDVVVLQAQNYSSSGAYSYPTSGAEELVRRATAGGARVVLFAEWPRAAVDESARIIATYAAITRTQPACLPPVPEAFDEARRANPELSLHNADGNHSSPAGAFLAATVLASAIVGGHPTSLPEIDQPGVSRVIQAELNAAAMRVWERVPTDRGC